MYLEVLIFVAGLPWDTNIWRPDAADAEDYAYAQAGVRRRRRAPDSSPY